MPTSIAELFASAGLVCQATVRWNTPIRESRPGVYIISLSNSLDEVSSCLPYPSLHRAVFEEWLQICPALTLNGTKPTIDHLMDRIGRFWLPDEAVLYIGLATVSLSKRIREYYKTPIGAKRPHSGGYFLKLLANLPELWVHYAIADHPETAESKMLQQFTIGVSEATRKTLFDPSHPFPFANLEWPRGIRKAHGILGARASSVTKPVQVVRAQSVSSFALHQNREKKSISLSSSGDNRTQQVTALDLKNGQIRIPSITTAHTKGLFPSNKSRVTVILRGRSIDCSWDPRMGPDRERSGVLRVRSVLCDLVSEGEILSVSHGADGMIWIE